MTTTREPPAMADAAGAHAAGRIRRGYVDAGYGQVHFRHCGRGTPLVLLHWTPISSRQYAHCLPLLAARGFDAYALDLPGYGQSDARDPDWRVADFAHAIAGALRALGLERPCLVGGHFSSLVATECALDAGVAPRCLVLDAPPLWDADLRRRISAGVRLAAPAVSADGAHERWLWQRGVQVWRDWVPGFAVTDATLPDVHLAMHDLVAMRFVSSAAAMGDYDLAARLPRVRPPCLVLGAERDLHVARIDDVCALLPARPARHVFAGTHPLHDPARAVEYVDVVARFLEQPA
jgi:pimeloyl-ACP methyl ester carboxylesterase